MENRIPPHNPEAEKAVLGGVLRVSDAYKKANAILSGENFYHERHRIIFAAMGALHEESRPVDLITLQEALRQDGHLETSGGVVFLSQLMDATPTADNIRHHAKIVLEGANRRRLIRVVQEAEHQAYEGSETVEEIGHRSVAALSRIVQGSNTGRFTDMAETMVSTIRV